ncbi:exodeoxyribonuclease V subunit beta [Thiomonas sp.]|uniref:exodeoxyribonuclease V subunit beta n=1 Tax=Thiomonas sp. TaxID=2047785 RepID=UPI002627D84C|nr:exodeoxyribonuclease V subunit beta [Thiomonas sp.]
MTAVVLDPLRLPLRASRLIEASAGTGKTWTIAALYLRLVLGHGGDDAGFGRPLTPEQILVMTFTRAATRELSERIRGRLVQAARCFRAASPVAADDTLLQGLLLDYPDEQARMAAAWRLEMAAQAMDDAAVFTIDAWCQRVLREHAFDSGQPFDEQLLADETPLLTEAVHDVWRQQLYPLDADELHGVLALWPSPEVLLDDVQTLRRSAQAGGVLPPAPADASLQALWQRLHGARSAQVQALKAVWRERVPAMRDWLLGVLQSSSCPLSKTRYSLDKAGGWFDALQTWLDTPQADLPALDAKAWHKLTADGLRQGCNKGRQIDVPPPFDDVAALRDALAALPDTAPALQAYAAAQVESRLQQLKRSRGQFSFHDQLRRLDAALAATHGARLRQRILQRYPVALIDEFQDTSALQFSVFDRLYAISGQTPADCAVLLIGDPKQSIYAFRGADIASYLRASAATAGRHAVLQTNYRSTTALVQAVNRLFGRREQAAGAGAFLYREGSAADAPNPLPFIEVGASGRSERLVQADSAVPALHLVVSAGPEAEPKQQARTRFAALASARIVELLGDAQTGFAHADGTFRRLRPADIAVLVRDADEAAAMRQALQRCGVASVYLSDRDSIFASQEAADVLRWLRAVAAPRDGRLARAAYASATLGLSLAELAALASDDAVFESRLELLDQLHRVWQHQGVLPMLRQTLYRLDLAARWLAGGAGERRLTNVLHLAELLQTASVTLDGEQALIGWLHTQITASDSDDEQIVRLESEADLVRVVTIHKSKGLEYPVVLLPFSTACKPAEDAAGDVERLREDVRLLYVALTRAQHALWVGVAALRQGNAAACVFHRSAIGYLLGGEQPRDASALRPLLDSVFGDMPAVRIDNAPAVPPVPFLRPQAAAKPLVEPAVYTAVFDREWSIGSYSALVRDLPPRSTQQGAAPPTLQDELWETEVLPGVPSPPVQDVARHRFPRGALTGRFVHEQLAWLAGHGFALAGDEALQQRLRQRCARQGWDAQRTQDVIDWLGEIVSTPLPPLSAALSDLRGVLAEAEFWLPVQHAPAAQIDALCRDFVFPGQPRPELTPRVLHGMVMGFADLVFAHGGRYWVLDYKSNVLGGSDADYTTQALQAAVLGHRYDVQSALYLLALHRLLRARLGSGYDASQHLGGAIDWFLRGVRAPQAGCVHIAAHPALLDALDALLQRSAQTAP